MKFRIAVALCLAAACGFVFAGCGGGGAGPQDRPNQARQIEDGADKYDPMQVSCPVCDTQSISGDYYADVDGKRIYFDKQECEDKFKENPQQYLQDFQTYKESMQKTKRR